jgi:hypothetical protein
MPRNSGENLLGVTKDRLGDRARRPPGSARIGGEQANSPLWLQGVPIAPVVVGEEADALQFVEGGLIYRLPWEMEAIRVRGIANGDIVGDSEFKLEEFELGVVSKKVVQSIRQGFLLERVWPQRRAAASYV